MTNAEAKYQTLHQYSIPPGGDPIANAAREDRLPKQKAISYQVLKGDVLDRLGDLHDESVHCVVTTPPKWGIRDCGGCTWDGQLGLEPTREEYLDKMVAIFREVRRVLRTDGTCWINMGTNYDRSDGNEVSGMPWRVVNALEDDGWWLRAHISWGKSNPMPESDTGRLFESNMFLLAKTETYFYDLEAVKEPVPGSLHYRDQGDSWTIPWEDSREAYLASMPVKLVEPCVLAGTSDKGCCAQCGAPWERVIEEYDTGLREKMTDGYRRPLMQTRTLSWTPTCDCLKPQLVPCTVLDPFSSAGITGVVALDLKRNYIGIQPAPQ
jgi:DNA modification methylase